MKKQIPVLVIISTAILIRILFFFQWAKWPWFSYPTLDALLYHEDALRLTQGQDLYPGEALHMSPVYTGFLAFCYKLFGVNPVGIRVAQMILGVSYVVLLFHLAKRLGGKVAGYASLLFSCFYGPILFFEQQISAASVGLFLQAAWIASSLYLIEHKHSLKHHWYAAWGIIFGLLVLLRPNALLLLALWPLCLAWSDKKKALIQGLIAGTCFFLMLMPITLRNKSQTGDLILVTDSGGLNFFIGNGPDANGAFQIPKILPSAANARTQFKDYKEYAEKEMGTSLSPKAVDSFWYGKTREYIRQNPGHWIALLKKKFRMFWSAQEIPNSESYEFMKRISPWFSLPWINFLWLGPLAILGMVLQIQRRRREDWFLIGVNTLNCGALVLFFVLAHYRLPCLVGLALSASIGIAEIVRKFKEAPWKSWLLPLSGGALGLMLALVPAVEINYAREFYKLGVAYHHTNQIPEAEKAYRQALALDDTIISAHKNLAVILEKNQNSVEALQEWRKVYDLARSSGSVSHEKEALQKIQNASKISP